MIVHICQNSRVRLAMALVFLGAALCLSVIEDHAEANPGQGRQLVAQKSEGRPTNSSDGQTKRVKYKKDTKVNFDDALIEGGVKNPFSSMIGSRDGDNKTGFVKVRKEWHDQMIMSVNGLSQ